MASRSPSVASSVASSQSSKTGLFAKWQKSSSTRTMSSTSTSSLFVDPIVSDLVRKNIMLNDELNEVKEVSNLNQSTLQVLARDLESKDQECMELRQSVHTLKTDFEIFKKGRDDELAILQAQLRELTVYRDAPKLERDHHSEQLVLLQQENKILANRATIAENTISKYMACVNTLKQQYQSLCTFLNQEQQAGEKQIDAEGTQ